MLGISEIKAGKNIIWEGQVFKVLTHEHSKMGRAGAVLRTKLKNLKTGAVLEKTFQGADKVEEADLEVGRAQYLYRDNDDYFFMDQNSFEQFSLTGKTLGPIINYLVEGTEVNILSYQNEPLNVDLPVKMKIKVTEAPPGIKGDTASGGNKLITLETGLKINAPLFIKTGDTVIVNTEKGEYVSRA